MGSALQSSSMKVVAALTVLCLLAAPAMSKNLGSINVKDFGEVFVCAPDWAAGAIQMHDNGFTMNGNSRLCFCNRAVDGWDPNAYWQTPLNNKHFAYTLDLSNVGCHCNAAAYSGLAGAYGAYGYGLAAPAYAAAPIAAAPIAAATYAAPAVAAPAVVAPAPARYAVPAPRVIEEAPIVEKIVEPVEQWGYKIKY